MVEAKDTLKSYLQEHREALLWKLEGLSERDLRWPHTQSGTNLLGLVFDRPSAEPLPWLEPGAEDNADMWATAEQSREWVVDFYHRAWVHADTTIDALELSAPGRVSWWGPEKQDVTLHQIMVHMIAESARHAGHADIVREMIDGQVGLREANTNVPSQQEQWWADYMARLQRAAEEAGRK